jgi:hypothetical protein
VVQVGGGGGAEPPGPRLDPTLAGKYHRLMVDNGKHHNSALCHASLQQATLKPEIQVLRHAGREQGLTTPLSKSQLAYWKPEQLAGSPERGKGISF